MCYIQGFSQSTVSAVEPRTTAWCWIKEITVRNALRQSEAQRGNGAQQSDESITSHGKQRGRDVVVMGLFFAGERVILYTPVGMKR